MPTTTHRNVSIPPNQSGLRTKVDCLLAQKACVSRDRLKSPLVRRPNWPDGTRWPEWPRVRVLRRFNVRKLNYVSTLLACACGAIDKTRMRLNSTHHSAASVTPIQQKNWSLLGQSGARILTWNRSKELSPIHSTISQKPMLSCAWLDRLPGE